MQITGTAKLARIFVGESDTLHGRDLAGVLVSAARKHGMAGATAWRGTTGFGAGSRIRTDAVLDLSSDLPMIVEIADTPERLESFLPLIDAMLTEARCGGMVTIENVEIRRYTHC